VDDQSAPIEGATIILKGTVRTAATNDDGEFIFKQLSPGIYTLIISKSEYLTITQDVDVELGKTENVNIVLSDASISIENLRPEILKGVGGNEHLAAVSDLAVYAGKKNEVIRLDQVDANIPMNNTRQIFARVPGISIWENDGTGIQLGVGSRGFSPNRSIEFNTRMNGYEITPDPSGYPEAYYMPPLEVVDRIEIVRGASSLQYGSGYSGLMNFVLKKPDISRSFIFKSQNTAGSYGMFSTFNYIGGTVGKLNYTVFYQKRFGNTSRENSYYNTDNAHAEIGYAFSNKFKLNTEITVMNTKIQQSGGLTDAQFAVNDKQSTRSRNWFGTPWVVPALTAEYLFSDDAKLVLKGFATMGQRNSIGFLSTIDKADSAQFNRQIDRHNYDNFGGELRFQKNYKAFGQKSTLSAGARYYNGSTRRQEKGKGDAGTDFNLNLQEAQFPSDLNYKSNNVALFAENVFNITSKLAATVGFRYESLLTNAQGNLSRKSDGSYVVLPLNEAKRSFPLFGAGLEYYVTKESNIYTNFTQVYRAVYFADLAVTDVIDTELKDSRGYNIDFGYRGKIAKWLNFDVSYFNVNYGNRIGTIDVLNDDKKGTYKFRTNVGSSQSSGFEGYVEVDAFVLAGLNKSAGNLSVFANVSMTDAKYNDFKTTKAIKDNDTGLFSVTETTLQGNKLEYAPQSIKRFGVSYSNKNLSATWQLSSVGEVFTDAANTVAPNASATVGKIAAYQIQDFSMSYKFLKHYNVKVSVNNLTDAKYATRRAGGYPGPGLMPGEGRAFYISGGVTF
jgi:Fe(3+) dicitrate transport protein